MSVTIRSAAGAEPPRSEAKQRSLKIEGHSGIKASVLVEAQGPAAVLLAVTDDDKIQELKMLLGRALNCLDRPPQWAMDLADALDAKLPT